MAVDAEVVLVLRQNLQSKPGMNARAWERALSTLQGQIKGHIPPITGCPMLQRRTIHQGTRRGG
jgi:hypothetical protein